jgi:hypothetical protein
MVFGLFENNGSIELRVNGTSFAPGQKITGTVTANLAKQIKARELRVSFYGEMIASAGRRGSQHVRILEVRQILSGEKLYSPGETFNFELPIPQPIEFRIPDNAIGGLMEGMAHVRPGLWFVHATLDISIASSLNNRVEITMAEEMVKTVKVPAPTQQDQIALSLHNAEVQRILAGGALPPQTGQPLSQ